MRYVRTGFDYIEDDGTRLPIGIDDANGLVAGGLVKVRSDPFGEYGEVIVGIDGYYARSIEDVPKSRLARSQ